MRLWRTLTTAVLLCALLAAACDPPARQAPPAGPVGVPSDDPSAAAVTGGTFRYAIEEPRAIIPPLATTSADQAVVDAVFDSLVLTDIVGRPVPSAAVEWSANGDATAWRFLLRPGATFQDGTPVTADTFVQAWSVLARDGAMAHLIRDVAGFDAVASGDAQTLSGLQAADELTLDVVLVRPRGDFPILVSHPALGPLHPAGSADPSPGDAEQPIGNGPFRLSEPWAHGQFIRVARWEDWMNGERPVDAVGEVVFRIGDVDTNFTFFRDGLQDFSPVPPEALALAAEEYPPQGGEYSGPGLIIGRTPVAVVLGINPSVPPFDDPDVRDAVSLFIDRQLIAQSTGNGNLDPSDSLVPPTVIPTLEDVCERCTYNPIGAVLRLQDAGVTSLSLSFNAGVGNESIRDVIRESLRSEGIGLISNRRGAPPAFEDYIALLEAGDVGLFRLTLSADVPSALEVLYPLLHSSEVPQAGGLNYMRYSSPVVDSLLEQAARTVDRTSRDRLLSRVQDVALNGDQIIVPIVSLRHAAVMAERVGNLRYDPYGRIRLESVRLLDVTTN